MPVYVIYTCLSVCLSSYLLRKRQWEKKREKEREAGVGGRYFKATYQHEPGRFP